MKIIIEGDARVLDGEVYRTEVEQCIGNLEDVLALIERAIKGHGYHIDGHLDVIAND